MVAKNEFKPRQVGAPEPVAVKTDSAATDRGAEAPSQASAEETNVWPTEAEEAAFLAESRGPNGPAAVAAPPRNEIAPNEETEDTSKPLPKLDELVNRIPAETRELLDDLFRAKFTTVRRVKKRDLKQ